MTTMTPGQLKDARQRATLFGLVQPFVDAFLASNTPLRMPRKSNSGVWTSPLARGGRVELNMERSDCGTLVIDKHTTSRWHWKYGTPVQFVRCSENRAWESRNFGGTSCPLPDELFEKVWLNLHSGLVSFIVASGLQVSAAGRAVLFPTRQQ